jgi:hypothetical protein
MPSCSRRGKGKGNKGLKKGWNQGKAAASKNKFHDACDDHDNADEDEDDAIYSNDTTTVASAQSVALQSSACAHGSLSLLSLLLAAAIGMIHSY